MVSFSEFLSEGKDVKPENPVNPKDIDKALKSKIDSVRKEAIGHESANSRHLHKALSDPSDKVRMAAVQHINASHHHYNRALKDSSPKIRELSAILMNLALKGSKKK